MFFSIESSFIYRWSHVVEIKTELNYNLKLMFVLLYV